MNTIYTSFTLLSSGRLSFPLLRCCCRSSLSFGQQPADKMGRFNAVLFLVFALGLMSSAAMAKSPSRAQAPIATVPKAAPIESPEASPPPSAAPQGAKTPSSAPSTAAQTPSSATAQTPAHSPTAEGPGSALPPSSAAAATATVEKMMTIFGAALVGGAVFLL